MNLHEICLYSLNHEITQALACSKRLEVSVFSSSLANFGLLHFFVVSGAHLNLILRASKCIKSSRSNFYGLKYLCLFVFVGMCNFSPPVLRAFIGQSFKIASEKTHFHSPKLVHNFLSYLICLVIFNSSTVLTFSLNLSFTFYLIIFFSNNSTQKWLSSQIYMLSLPFLLFIFGVPHISSLVLTPVTAVFLSFTLLPLSLLAVFYNHAELLAIESWWAFQKFISSTNIFFNSPHKTRWSYEFISEGEFIFYNISFFTLTSIGVILWRRNSYSFL